MSNPNSRVWHSGGPYCLLIVLWGIVIFLLAVSIVAPSFTVLALGSTTLIVIGFPLFRNRNPDWFSPVAILFYSALIGIFLRSLYITLDIPDPATIDRLFLLGKPKDFFVWPMSLILLGMGCLITGYVVGPRHVRTPRLRVFSSDDWSEQRLILAVCALLVLAWIGFFLFVRDMHLVLALESLSAIRGVSRDLSDYNSHSYWRWMVRMAGLAAYILLAQILNGRRRWIYIHKMLLLLSIITILSFNVVTSSRGGFIFVIVNLLAVHYYMTNRRIDYKLGAALVVAVVLSVGILSGLRKGVVTSQDPRNAFAPHALIEPIVLNRSFIDVSKTAHIIAAVPNTLSYQYGKTMTPLLVAWIPRSLWRAKPVINVDNIVGMKVFGATAYGSGGVPVGLVAEMYWNFGVLGVVIGCFVAGLVLRFFYSMFLNKAWNKNAIILYVSGFMSLGMTIVGSSFNPTVIGVAMTVFPLLVILSFVTKPQSNRQHAAVFPSDI